MYSVDYYVSLLGRLNRLYLDVLANKLIDVNELDEIMDSVNGNDISSFSEDDRVILCNVIGGCSNVVSVIKYLLSKRDVNVPLQELRDEFLILEREHYVIVNKYITGIINVSDVNNFDLVLNKFKTKLYEYVTNEEDIMEVAKMKSKVQHFRTEVLEDEDLLKIAYSNGE